MRVSNPILSLLALFALSAGASDHRFEHDYVEDKVVDDLSFGSKSTIWAKDHRHITGWSILGEGYTPELQSDRVILTPLWPSSRRGAIWADHAETEPEWEAEFEFRASGADDANGHFQFWYVRNDSASNGVGTSSIYTAGRFDGVAVVISQVANSGGVSGMVRVFLNDASFAFKDHHNVDQLSWGQCDFNYRNLGKFSKIKISQTYWTFKVEVDGKKCIDSYAIHLPHNYYYGLTAASSDPPDSFEVKSFVVHKLKEGKRLVHDHGTGAKPDWHEYEDENEQWTHDASDVLREHGVKKEKSHMTPNAQSPLSGRGAKSYSSQQDNDWEWTTEAEQMKATDASEYGTETERFKDLHDRVTLLNHQIELLAGDLSLWKKQMELRHIEVMNVLATVSGSDNTKHTVETIEKEVAAIKSALGTGDLKGLLDQLHWVLNDNHLTISEAIEGNSPRLHFFAFLIVASNVLLLGSYLIYLKRKEAQPKKYL